MNDVVTLVERLGVPAAFSLAVVWMLWRAGRAVGGLLLTRAAAWFDSQIALERSLIERNRVEELSHERLQTGVDSIRCAGVEFCELALASNACEQLGVEPADIERIRDRLIDNSAVLSSLSGRGPHASS
ncbi:MAG: hypothetical protein DWQ42_05660 [Planctomycetota bacterium]|nr:MAG: hypothetical protein DWQ42_05660 [Planctomycetota bacterium]REK42460.1 MAG: hypothetical protein DWQ46_13300 [Planctomycetota bacterium]